ncbi:MAG: glycosyltransferase family 2 protein [Lachnospiraceae bacterium]|nr:glycosyltransferase family 2 protein [Lachnospiraceae bacterium]
MNMLSVILPAYNEEEMIPEAFTAISAVLGREQIPFELIYVNDGSADGTWEQIQKLCGAHANVTGVHFSRNFGKESAIFAGLEQAKGDCCVVMDCDLQHPPEKIVEMYRLWEQGYEVVEGLKADRGRESGSNRAGAGLFYRLMSRAAGFDMTASSDFKLLDRKVADTLNALPERGVFFRALSFWCGFRKTEVYYSVQPRTRGKSKWTKRALFRYAINNIGSFSSAPLHLVTVLGCIGLLVSLVFSAISLVQKIQGVALGGFTTVILLLLFIGSLIMISLGIIGYYIARIYTEIKGRPRYIVSEILGGKGND